MQCDIRTLKTSIRKNSKISEVRRKVFVNAYVSYLVLASGLKQIWCLHQMSVLKRSIYIIPNIYVVEQQWAVKHQTF